MELYFNDIDSQISSHNFVHIYQKSGFYGENLVLVAIELKPTL